jgi:hypothetical protein
MVRPVASVLSPAAQARRGYSKLSGSCGRAATGRATGTLLIQMRMLHPTIRIGHGAGRPGRK